MICCFFNTSLKRRFSIRESKLIGINEFLILTIIPPLECMIVELSKTIHKQNLLSGDIELFTKFLPATKKLPLSAPESSAAFELEQKASFKLPQNCMFPPGLFRNVGQRVSQAQIQPTKIGLLHIFAGICVRGPLKELKLPIRVKKVGETTEVLVLFCYF